jgi:hypothetical protein
LILGDSRFLDALGLEPNPFDLVFGHPAYGQLIDYSDENGVRVEDLSSLSHAEYLIAMARVMTGIDRVLKPERYFCILIGDALGKDRGPFH